MRRASSVTATMPRLGVVGLTSLVKTREFERRTQATVKKAAERDIRNLDKIGEETTRTLLQVSANLLDSLSFLEETRESTQLRQLRPSANLGKQLAPRGSELLVQVQSDALENPATEALLEPLLEPLLDSASLNARKPWHVLFLLEL